MAEHFSICVPANAVKPVTTGKRGSEEKIASIRAQLAEEFEPRAKRARAKWPVRIASEIVNGVRCQILSPLEKQADRDVLYFFGGGYVSGHPEFELPVTAALAVLARARIIVPEYSLAPEHPYPRAFSECFCLYRFLTQEVGRKLVLAGESAGGGLAVAVTRTALTGGLAAPEKLILFSPWVDLSEAGITASGKVNDPSLSAAELHLFANAYLAHTGRGNGIVSPGLNPVPAMWPDTFLTTATNDLLYQSVCDFRNQLEKAGATIEFRLEQGLWHVI